MSYSTFEIMNFCKDIDKVVQNIFSTDESLKNKKLELEKLLNFLPNPTQINFKNIASDKNQKFDKPQVKITDFSGAFWKKENIQKNENEDLVDLSIWPKDDDLLDYYHLHIIADELIGTYQSEIKFSVAALSPKVLERESDFNKQIGDFTHQTLLKNVVDEWQQSIKKHEGVYQSILSIALNVGGHFVYVGCLYDTKECFIINSMKTSYQDELKEATLILHQCFDSQYKITVHALGIQKDSTSCGHWVLAMFQETLSQYKQLISKKDHKINKDLIISEVSKISNINNKYEEFRELFELKMQAHKKVFK